MILKTLRCGLCATLPFSIPYPFAGLFGVLAFAGLFGFGLAAGELGEGAGHEYDGADLKDKKPAKQAPALLPAVLSVDESSVVRTYDAGLFGVCYDWWAINELKLTESVDKDGLPVVSSNYVELLKGVPLPLNRNCEENFSWKDALGPLLERKSQKLTPWDKGSIKGFGVAEWLKSALAIDPHAEFVWALNLGKASPSDFRDLAEFLTGSPETPWGAKRAALGVKAPVKVAIWELGNELDWSGHKISVERYIELSREAIAAIRQVQPDAVFCAHAATAPWHPIQAKDWLKWHRTILETIGGDIAYLSLHPYYHGYAASFLEPYIDKISADIKASAHPGIKIYISEHGKWPSGDSSKPEWKKYWYQTHALTGCLDTGEWLIRMLHRKDVGAMTYHNVSSGPWGMVYCDQASKKLYSTGMADLFRVFGKVPYGGKVLSSTIMGDETDVRSGNLSFTVAPVLSEDSSTLRLLMDNRNPSSARELSLIFRNGPYVLESQTLFTAESLNSFNSAESRPVGFTESSEGAGRELSSWTVPAKSLVLLTLKRKAGHE